MKNIMVKYTLQIPEDSFEKVCKKLWISKNELIKMLKDRAEVNGRVSVYDFVNKIINNKEDS